MKISWVLVAMMALPMLLSLLIGAVFTAAQWVRERRRLRSGPARALPTEGGDDQRWQPV